MVAEEVPEWPLALVVDRLVVGVLAAVVNSAADSFSVSFPFHSQCACGRTLPRWVAPAERRRGNFAFWELSVAILTSILTAAAVVQFIDLAVTAAATASGDRNGRRDRWPVGRR